MESVTQYIEQRLKLRVNRQKSAVAPAVERPLLGFQFFRDRDGKDRRDGRSEGSQTSRGSNPSADHAQLGRLDGAADQRDQPLHGRMDRRTSRFADTILPFEQLDKWLRRRLRQVRWKEWKRPQTRYRNLRTLGIPDHDARSWAASQKGYWRVAGSWPLQRALPNTYWHKTTGLKGFTRPLPPLPGMLSEPPGADPHAGWCGRGQGEPGPYPIRCGGGRQARNSRRCRAIPASLPPTLHCGHEIVAAASDRDRSGAAAVPAA